MDYNIIALTLIGLIILLILYGTQKYLNETEVQPNETLQVKV